MRDRNREVKVIIRSGRELTPDKHDADGFTTVQQLLGAGTKVDRELFKCVGTDCRPIAGALQFHK